MITPYGTPLAYYDGERAKLTRFDDEVSLELDAEALEWIALGICARGLPAEFWKRLPRHMARALLAEAPTLDESEAQS